MGGPKVGGRPWPFVERPESVPGTGVVDALHRTVRAFRRSLSNSDGRHHESTVCGGNRINRRNLHRAIMMFMTLLGFLLAVLVLAAVIRWSDPTCCKRMYRLVRQPVPVFARRPARRFLSSAFPWWFYPIMAPPVLPEPNPCRRSRLFRRY
jgi:hypothetical protein